MNAFGVETLPLLRPGDLLLYSGDSFFAKAIKFKTWSMFSHVETYLGEGQSHAARDGFQLWPPPKPGTGVGTFPIRWDGLVLVRRPLDPFSLKAAGAYLRQVEGQIYDWIGIFRFFTIGAQSQDRQFCSEDATRLARAAGIRPFTEQLDADLVTPRDLAVTPAYRDVLVAGAPVQPT